MDDFAAQRAYAATGGIQPWHNELVQAASNVRLAKNDGRQQQGGAQRGLQNPSGDLEAEVPRTPSDIRIDLEVEVPNAKTNCPHEQSRTQRGVVKVFLGLAGQARAHPAGKWEAPGFALGRDASFVDGEQCGVKIASISRSGLLAKWNASRDKGISVGDSVVSLNGAYDQAAIRQKMKEAISSRVGHIVMEVSVDMNGAEMRSMWV